MGVCIFAYSYRRHAPGSHGGEYDYWVRMWSENKYDKLTSPRSKFLFLRGDYRNRGHRPEKAVLESSPGKDVFCTLETINSRRGQISSAVSFGEKEQTS
jgi:hypothetical protein